jgi:predicted RNA methylase
MNGSIPLFDKVDKMRYHVQMQIATEVLNVLDASTLTQNSLILPEGQLERKLYVAVNKCLEAIGGKWNKKAKAHLFDADPQPLLEELILTGHFTDSKKEFQFFPTPEPVAIQLLELADIQINDTILEPSAGEGHIADVLAKRFPQTTLTCVELNPKMHAVLTAKGYTAHLHDFLDFDCEQQFDKVIMNPPFTRLQDVDHIAHAFSFLKPKGRLVSVVSESPFFRTGTKSETFGKFVESHGHSVKLPENSFKSSGTGVNTRIVVLNN